ncbi:MAG: ABC-F family ATP-binding cassette domain-containing protein [Spirochaetia bacterium]|nr:ABC-F family ATP-binding cassette domain-containing protein [Spirochaetia bacterium]
MNLLSVFEASKEIADKVLYEQISFGIDDDDKIAIIGINGCGKSTLMRILSGLDHFDSGKYTTNNSLKIGYLDQSISFDPEQTIQEYIFSSDNERMRVLRDHMLLQSKMMDGHHGDDDFSSEMERLEDKMNDLDVWKLEGEAREILFQLNIEHMEFKMGELSGGMIKKTALARLLIEDNNLLMLDEPTNHLDMASIAWLEEYLVKIKKALILITHDRYFLDNVVNHILEIDNRQISKYRGHYSYYLEKKAEIAAIEQRTLERHQNILTTELKWLSRMPKARGTKQKAKTQKIEARHSLVQSMQKKEGMGALYSSEQKTGKKIIEAVNISKSFGNELVFPSFYYEFARKERIAVIGENGAGKTTFLKILMKSLEPDTGSIVHGVNTKIAYLSQHSDPVDSGLSLIQAVKEIANYIEYEDGKKISASQLLDRFLFEGGKHHQKVNRLSGGERRRLDIIRILMTNPNFLILDEPTNDLDLQTLSIFEDYLLEFPGCLVVVSHDRYFLDKLTDKLLIFEKGQPIRTVFGLCSDNIQQASRFATKKEKTTPENSVIKEIEKNKKNIKLSYKMELRKKELEKEIPVLEVEIKTLEENLSSGEPNAKLLADWGSQHIEKESRLFGMLAELEKIEKM